MTQDSNKSLTYIYQIFDIPFCVIFQISDFESFSRQKFEFRIEIFSVKSKTKVKFVYIFGKWKTESCVLTEFSGEVKNAKVFVTDRF